MHFLLEPLETTATPAADRDEAAPPESSLWPCSKGHPPASLPTGAPRPGELEELERHIEGMRERLRQALVRRGELLVQLGDGTHGPLHLLQACGEVPRPAH